MARRAPAGASQVFADSSTNNPAAKRSWMMTYRTVSPYCVRRNEKMVGFIEVSAVSGSKYGMGSGVPLANTRPVVSNLAVDPNSRRCGIGTALMEACQDMIKTWNFEEIILQV